MVGAIATLPDDKLALVIVGFGGGALVLTGCAATRASLVRGCAGECCAALGRSKLIADRPRIAVAPSTPAAPSVATTTPAALLRSINRFRRSRATSRSACRQCRHTAVPGRTSWGHDSARRCGVFGTARLLVYCVESGTSLGRTPQRDLQFARAFLPNSRALPWRACHSSTPKHARRQLFLPRRA